MSYHAFAQSELTLSPQLVALLTSVPPPRSRANALNCIAVGCEGSCYCLHSALGPGITSTHCSVSLLRFPWPSKPKFFPQVSHMNVRRHPSSFPAAVLDASPSTTPSTPTNRPLHPTPAAATTSQPASTHEADKPAYRPCLSFILDGHRLEHIDKGHKWIEDATSIMQKLSLGEDDPELARWKPQIAL